MKTLCSRGIRRLGLLRPPRALLGAELGAVLDAVLDAVLGAGLSAVLGAVLCTEVAAAQAAPAVVSGLGEVPARAAYAAMGGAKIPYTYGIVAATSLTLQAASFTPVSPTTTWDAAIGLSGWQKFRTGGGVGFATSVNLPSGATVTAMELDGCDNSTTAGLSVDLFVCGVGSACYPISGPVTGNPDTGGCTFWFLGTSSSPTINNSANSYAAVVSDGGTDNQTSFQAVRIYYRLNISPAPLVASFTDVPTTFSSFQAVEALKASGITLGCTATEFCPTQPVTRQQMAVFLARALGLHWAP